MVDVNTLWKKNIWSKYIRFWNMINNCFNLGLAQLDISEGLSQLDSVSRDDNFTHKISK